LNYGDPNSHYLKNLCALLAPLASYIHPLFREIANHFLLPA